jgi:hypothetical protein
MEACTVTRLEPGLEAIVAIPDHAFEEGIHERHDQHRGAQLRAELGALGNTARDDRWNRSGEGEQEKELHQAIAMVLRQHRSRFEEIDAVGDPVADEEVRQGGDSEIRENFR